LVQGSATDVVDDHERDFAEAACGADALLERAVRALDPTRRQAHRHADRKVIGQSKGARPEKASEGDGSGAGVAVGVGVGVAVGVGEPPSRSSRAEAAAR
jgi:hypothetical protein